ncbi:MAG: NDP-sugar synthase [Actinobacteria bacterium]|nr:NDP-sugar synthase [Actinomycetota bacterium]MBW3641708.1 NDP-sugar synthase [Actinomycetota bacterium]
MRAVVLVGGLGTRLRPLTLRTPKQMLPVAGRPMIEHVVAHLADHGVDEVVLSLGYRPDAFTASYPDATCAGVRLVYAVEPEPLDTAGAIRFAAAHAGIDERFLVVNGDVLSDLDLSELVSLHDAVHHGGGAEATIQLVGVEDPSPYGAVSTDASGRVTAFVEKPPSGEIADAAINAGYYVLEPQVLERIPEGRRVNIERETFPAMVAEGVLYATVGKGWWIDVGTPERYVQASLDLLDRAGDGPPSVVAPSAMVATTATVSRSVLGPGCRIGRNARVEDSIVFSRAVIGNGATVRRSVIGAAAVVGDAATVADLSVLGNGTEVDGGAELVGAILPGPETWPAA